MTFPMPKISVIDATYVPQSSKQHNKYHCIYMMDLSEARPRKLHFLSGCMSFERVGKILSRCPQDSKLGVDKLRRGCIAHFQGFVTTFPNFFCRSLQSWKKNHSNFIDFVDFTKGTKGYAIVFSMKKQWNVSGSLFNFGATYRKS